MDSENQAMTGYPTKDLPWMKYYPEALIKNLSAPDNTVLEYLEKNCPGEDEIAMHYYGIDITWKAVFEQIDLTARALKSLGFGEGDQIPVFICATPEFVYLLLAAERIGASILCRDNTLEENAEAVKKSGAKMIFAHDYLSQEELSAYRHTAGVHCAVLLSPYRSGQYRDTPEHIRQFIDEQYSDKPAYGPKTVGWDAFLEFGKAYEGEVDAARDINRPLYRGYTSGSTGPSKQVIHCARTMLGNLHQMNFYGSSDEFRANWMVTCLPPSLVAVVVAMVLLPLASNKLLILNPFCRPEDVDLELMRYRPNCWPTVPMLFENLVRSKRVPDDYDMSHLMSCGAGAEAYNNHQILRAQKYFVDHGCKARFTTGYGCSEAGSNMTLPMSPRPIADGNVGIPMPLSVIAAFKPGTQEELKYNEIGEICFASPSVMLGYDSKKATARALQEHPDGRMWLHTGDIGYVTEEGVVYVLTRGTAHRFGFENCELATLPMENRLADAKIEGIQDEFFVIAPDPEHRHHFLPYLYIVLKDGYTCEDVTAKIDECLEDYMKPVEVKCIAERPFFHFKTNRIGLMKELMTKE